MGSGCCSMQPDKLALSTSKTVERRSNLFITLLHHDPGYATAGAGYPIVGDGQPCGVLDDPKVGSTERRLFERWLSSVNPAPDASTEARHSAHALDLQAIDSLEATRQLVAASPALALVMF